MTYKQKAEDLYSLINTGKLMDGFEKYYHQDVVMQEIGEEKRTGKDVNREYELKFLGMIKEVHDAGVTAMASDEENGIVFVENFMDMTFQDGNRVNMAQVCVQKWDGDFIVSETFYHK